MRPRCQVPTGEPKTKERPSHWESRVDSEWVQLHRTISWCDVEGGAVVQGLAPFPHSKNLGLNLQTSFLVSLLSGFSGFLPQTEHKPLRLIGNSKGVNVRTVMDWWPVQGKPRPSPSGSAGIGCSPVKGQMKDGWMLLAVIGVNFNV